MPYERDKARLTTGTGTLMFRVVDDADGSNPLSRNMELDEVAEELYTLTVYAADEFATKLAALGAADGGMLRIKPGSYTVTDNLSYDVNDGPVVIDARGATITFASGVVGLTITNSTGGGGSYTGAQVWGGNWRSNGTPTHGIRILDCSRTKLFGLDLTGATFETAIELRNENSYCEQTQIIGGSITGSKHAIDFSPRSVTGGGPTGTESFARTRIMGLSVSGGSAGEYLVRCRGGVYDSTIFGIGGNLLPGAHGIYLSGAMGGTYIDNIGFEGGDATSVGITSADPWGSGAKPFIGASYDFRNSIIDTAGDSSPSRKLNFLGRVGSAQYVLGTSMGVQDVLGPATSLYVNAAGYLSTPDSAALSITGDIDIRAAVLASDWTPGTNRLILAKQGGASSNISYRLQANTDGTLSFRWSTDGTTLVTETKSAAHGFSNATWGIVRATLDIDDGGGQHVLTYYTSSDGGSTWTQLSQHTLSGTTSIYDGTAALEFGAWQGGTASWVGRLGRGQVYDGIDGTLVADARCDANTAPAYRDELGNEWTYGGTYLWMMSDLG